MKRIPIFRAGTHRASSGASHSFSEAMLKEAAQGYDPALSEAPIVVGHPATNLPAYGWVERIEYNEDTKELAVIPKQVDPEFNEMVQKGRFKQRSASWYLPDSPTNPKPGTLYLRHVGFLGAEPPAIKGLRPVEFAEAGEGVVEFGEANLWLASSVAHMARSLREWLIGKDGKDVADQVIPNYLVSDLETASKELQSPPPPPPTPVFNEGQSMQTIQEFQEALSKMTAERDRFQALAAGQANFSEREASLKEREQRVAQEMAKLSRTAIETRVDAAIKAGRLLPAQKALAVDFAQSLQDGEATLDFSEGDKVIKLTQREVYLRQLETAPKVVEYGESAPGGSSGSQEPSLEDITRQISTQVATGKA